MPFQAVLFDLDGTLLDTLEDLAHSANLALAQLGLDSHPLEAYRYFVGDGVETLMRRAIPPQKSSPQLLQRGSQLMRTIYAQHWNRKTHPYPGIPQLLDTLSAQRLPMAVLSNKPHEFTALCVEKILPRWRFDLVQGSCDGIPKKPDPAGALAAAQHLGLPPEAIVYLGDTDTDMQTARAAGMFPVGVLWGFRSAEELRTHGARVLLEHPLDLLKVLHAPAC